MRVGALALTDWAAFRDLLPGGPSAFHHADPLLRSFAVMVLHRAASNPAVWRVRPPPTADV